MTGSAKAHYDGIVAFSQIDFTDDLKKIDISPCSWCTEMTIKSYPTRTQALYLRSSCRMQHLRPTRAFPIECPRRRRTRSTPTSQPSCSPERPLRYDHRHTRARPTERDLRRQRSI